jgi:hypothetical protein
VIRHQAEIERLPAIAGNAPNIQQEDSMDKSTRKFMVSNQRTAADYGKVQATHTHEGDTVAAVVDGRIPDRSDDQAQPRWTSLPFKNRGQNIIFELDEYHGEEACTCSLNPSRSGRVGPKARGGS